jgi:hypothetical protein
MFAGTSTLSSFRSVPMDRDRNGLVTSSYAQLLNRVDEEGRIVPLPMAEPKVDDASVSVATDSAAIPSANGQDQIDYVHGVRFWLITVS